MRDTEFLHSGWKEGDKAFIYSFLLVILFVLEISKYLFVL